MSQVPEAAGLRRWPAVAAAILIGGALLAACSNSNPTPRPSPSGLTSIAIPATASPAPEASGPVASGPGETPTIVPGPSATAGSTITPAPVTPAPAKFGLTMIVRGLSSPVGVASAGDPRLFVVEQTGQVKIVSGGALRPTPFLNIASRISCCGERGLLGLAFHPSYASNGRFFVRYTTPAGDVRVSEFHRNAANPDLADPGSERVIITIPHPSFGNHNGGTIAFGPDGYLYIGTGDGGGGGDPFHNGQNLNALLGKMLRLDVDHSAGANHYAIPAGNPFAGQAGRRAEIWAYGLRNPYGFSFDRTTGDLWIADVGQGAWEEVDRATAAAGLGRGANYGWNVMEGAHCFSPSSGCSTAGKVEPLAEYNHGAGSSIGCAIIGGFVYRGSRHPDLAGLYFFGDDCSGRIWDVVAAGPAAQSPHQRLSSGLNITGWGQGADGELYVVAADGTLSELV